MKFSVIIPAFNSARTLGRCLEAVSESGEKSFETVVVDDKSSDATADISKRFSCRVVSLEANRGPAHARNRGHEFSQGDFLVFVDSDVVMPPDALTRIGGVFERNPGTVAVTGLLAKDPGTGGFFTAYKNLYMNFVFKNCPGKIDFLHGSVMAIRREHFPGFDESFRVTDDTELGQHFKKLGRNILLDKELEVQHLKTYGLWEILRNDFRVPFWWARSFWTYGGFIDLFKKGSFAHSRLSQLAGLCMSFFSLVSLGFPGNETAQRAALLFSVLFVYFNRKFFNYLYRQKGARFATAAVFFTWIDQSVMALGALCGLVYWFVRRLVTGQPGGDRSVS